MEAEREWYRVESSNGSRSWKMPFESCLTFEVLPCLISPANAIYRQWVSSLQTACGEPPTSPPKTSTMHSKPMQTPSTGTLPIPHLITSRLIPLSVVGWPGPGEMTTRSRSPASYIA
jgi:hypothetical protein